MQKTKSDVKFKFVQGNIIWKRFPMLPLAVLACVRGLYGQTRRAQGCHRKFLTIERIPNYLSRAGRMEITFNLENCYGIGRFSEALFKGNKNVCVIYASNGTMKTSLTNALRDICDNGKPKDVFYPERRSKCEITIDGESICPDFIYIFECINVADPQYAKYISALLARKDLKDRYDAILNELDEKKKSFSKEMKSIAKSTDCESEIIESFKKNENENFFDCLVWVKNILDSTKSLYRLYQFKFNDVFDKRGKVREFIEKYRDKFVDFVNRYNELIESSDLFTSGANAFGTTQASNLLAAVGDNRFFKASHTLELKGGTRITTKEEFEKLIAEAKDKLMADEKIKETFDQIDKKLSGNADLRNFKEVIVGDKSIITEVVSYENFRKDVILGYVQNRLGDQLSAIVSLYKSKSAELRDIIKKANEESNKWKDIIDLYNDRFFVPFTVRIENKADMLLKEDAASIVFEYKDGGSAPVFKKSDELISHLSRGEQRAFNILQNLFAIESRKTERKPTLVVFDDVADSFDYKNKYAIVEYLVDIMEVPDFYLLILTHNFDFYRTAISRLGKAGVDARLAERNEKDRSIKLGEGIYQQDILKKIIEDAGRGNSRAFIGMIPFVRNIVEYTRDASCAEYVALTSCLHQKDKTSSLRCSDIASIMKKVVYGFDVKKDDSSLYTDVLFKEADSILRDSDDFNLPCKLVLSIAIRLKAEEYMLSVLNKEEIGTCAKRNQTRELYERMKQNYFSTHKTQCLLMNKILIMTSENIHINNFMFEPLVDTSIAHLKKLYEDVRGLLPNRIPQGSQE